MTDELGGGQLWEQPDFPNNRRYVVYLPGGKWILMAPPLDAQGSLVATLADGKWQYTEAELRDHLSQLGYVNRGQYYDVEYAKWDEILAGRTHRESRA